MMRCAGILIACMLLAGVLHAESNCPPLKRPSVLLITIDTLRADHLGLYGYARADTPAIDGLAKESVVFENAIAQVPLTFPSHAAILTGTQPFRNAVRDFTSPPLEARWMNVAQPFHSCGYATGAVVSSFVLERSWGLARGFDLYDDAFDARQFATKNVALVERPAAESIDHALRWLRARRQKPFFLWLHLYDPHSPYRPPEPFLTRFRASPYDGEIAYVDAQLQRLFAYLKDSGAWNRTAIVLTSDHGESLGEHGEKEHGFFVYRSTTHVPLMLKPADPNIRARRVMGTVQSVDIAPTLLQIAGIHSPMSEQFDGKPLPLKRGTGGNRFAYSETMYPLSSFGWSGLRSLQNDEYHYVEAPTPELYALSTDPRETKNVARNRPALVKASSQMLDGMHAAAQALSAERDAQSIAKLQSLGYLAFTAPPNARNGNALADPKEKIGELEDILAAQDAMQTGDFEHAEARLAEVEKRDPQLYLVPFMRAEAEMRRARWTEAAAQFKHALELNPGFEQALTGLATAYQRSGNTQEARQLLESAVAKRAENFRLWYQLGLAQEKDSPAEAQRAFEQAIRLQPNFGYAYRDLGLLLAQQHSYADAARNLRRAVETGVHEAPVYNMLGISERQLHNPRAAIAAYETALKIDPDLAEAHLNLGLALEDSGRVAAAKEHYTRACELKAQLCKLARR